MSFHAIWLIILALAVAIEAQTVSLTPTGTLRATFLGDNPSLGRVDRQTGTVTGPVAELVKDLARRLDIPYVLIPASGARDVMMRLQAGTADLGFMAYNAGRAAEVDFSIPWLLMPNTYIVAAASRISKVADADRPGVKIGAVKNDTQDVYLSANLKNTRVEAVTAMPSPAELEEWLLAGKLEAFAANRQRLIEVADRFPKLRVVADNFFVAGQAVAVAKGNPARVETLNKLVDAILATDVVKSAIEHAGLRGVDAAAPQAR